MTLLTEMLLQERYYNFQSFPTDCGIQFRGSFRENVGIFLEKCAYPCDDRANGMPTWCTVLLLKDKSGALPVYTIEEDVERSPDPFCGHCRTTGWAKHFVSKRKYHFVIPNDLNWNRPLTSTESYTRPNLLHGIVHCNGYGHLESINRCEHLNGKAIMDLWDHICEKLRARKISVEDVSKKHGMELRLLHGVAYGRTWFGRWGYKRGCGNNLVTNLVTNRMYYRYLRRLRAKPIRPMIKNLRYREDRRDLNNLLRVYEARSDQHLITMRDLFNFMLPGSSAPAVVHADRDILWEDLKMFYYHLLYKESDETLALVENNQLVKCFRFNDEDDRWLQFEAKPKLTFAQAVPGEFITVPVQATLLEVKAAIENALTDTYCFLGNVQVSWIEGLTQLEDTDLIFGKIRSGQQVSFGLNNELDMSSFLRFEGDVGC